MARVCRECGARYDEASRCARDGAELTEATGLVGQTVGNHVLVEVLGSGGMGTVYKAVHPEIGAPVAIKVMRAVPDERDESGADRFFAEARATGQLRHDHIVKVIDFGKLDDRRPYLTMEYLDGAALSEIIRRSAPLPIGTTSRLMRQVLDALEAAHRRGIIHRDLKPANLFVTAGGRPVVLDFGIAKLHDSSRARLTKTGALVGTPAYMAPEQIRGEEVDHRADLYAVGIVLFEALTGVRPFAAESEFELLSMQLEQPPTSPRFLRRDLPAALEEVILTALAKAPHQRYGSAAEMAAALQQASADLGDGAFAELSIPGETAETPARPGRVGWTAETAPARPKLEPRASEPTSTAPSSSRRRWLVPGAALLGLGLGAALVLWLSEPPASSSASRSPDAAPARTVEAAVDATTPVADAAIEMPFDAAPRPTARPRPIRRPAARMVDAGSPDVEKPKPSPTTTTPRPRFKPGPTTVGRLDRFRPDRFFRDAHRLAREHHRDAELSRAVLQGVRPDGTIDLTRAVGGVRGTASYFFGVPSEPITVAVAVNPDGYVAVGTTTGGSARARSRTPRCSPRALWLKLAGEGKVARDAATGRFEYSRSRWKVQIPTGKARVLQVPDRCD